MEYVAQYCLQIILLTYVTEHKMDLTYNTVSIITRRNHFYTVNIIRMRIEDPFKFISFFNFKIFD